MTVQAPAQTLLGEEPALGSVESRMTQAEIAGGGLSLTDIRFAGLKMFATAFRKADGYGDQRPSLQGNGTFLRVNGLDAQSCLECHSVISAGTLPATFGIGGAGTINSSALSGARAIDVADSAGNGFAAFDGRLINPPALFGTGGVQLVAQEMTQRLQKLKRRALRQPGRPVRLSAKGVDFGELVADAAGNLDTSGVVGIDADLVVRPFGRKGEFTSVRDFDLGAFVFHFGMSPAEVAGAGIDDDDDGVINEVLVGEVSALEIFVTTQESPVREAGGQAGRRGFRRFRDIGCSDCHRPQLRTSTSVLTYSQPEIATDPTQNVFYAVDLRDAPMRFRPGPRGGVIVPLFSDLKRHDMGDELAETFHAASEQQNREFITAKLWGVADTAPYLHDGRAHTLNEAILMHGGAAEAVRNAYAALSDAHRNEVLAFLGTLRNPESPNSDVLE